MLNRKLNNIAGGEREGIHTCVCLFPRRQEQVSLHLARVLTANSRPREQLPPVLLVNQRVFWGEGSLTIGAWVMQDQLHR